MLLRELFEPNLFSKVTFIVFLLPFFVDFCQNLKQCSIIKPEESFQIGYNLLALFPFSSNACLSIPFDKPGWAPPASSGHLWESYPYWGACVSFSSSILKMEKWVWVLLQVRISSGWKATPSKGVLDTPLGGGGVRVFYLLSGALLLGLTPVRNRKLPFSTY